MIMEHFEIAGVSMLALLRHCAGQRVPTSAAKYTFVRSATIGAKGVADALASSGEDIML